MLCLHITAFVLSSRRGQGSSYNARAKPGTYRRHSRPSIPKPSTARLIGRNTSDGAARDLSPHQACGQSGQPHGLTEYSWHALGE